jgi:DNA modification methylase
MLLTGNCLQLINEIDDNIIQTIVTSPPYWGLRDYEGEEEQLGQEETPEKYVTNLVAFFRLCKPKLKDDGTVWLNIGDTYFGAKGGHWEGGNSITSDETGHNYRMHRKAPPKHKRLKTKDLCGVPWMVAFTMQKDGWYLRQDIIWHKPNPMPEAVTDRCVKSHEHIFLFSLKPRYYFDHEAIQEKALYAGDNRASRGDSRRDIPLANNMAADSQPTKEFRNKRDVWTINTAQSGEAHFAVFPPKIPELCIKAGTREGDVVLDPFMGSGTTALVAQRLGRKWIGFELNEKYAELITSKTAQGELF